MSPQTPKRIQRKRTKGWRMAGGAIYVGRTVGGVSGSPFANYYRVGPSMSPKLAVELYRREITGVLRRYPDFLDALRGHDLACWCRVCPVHVNGKPFGVECPDCQPCHADVLGALASGLSPEPAE